jgi:hypothetical protein
VLVSPSVQPWYFSLPLALAVVLGASSTVGMVTIGYTVLALPVLYLQYYLRDATPFWVNMAYGLAPLLPLFCRWARPSPQRTHKGIQACHRVAPE